MFHVAICSYLSVSELISEAMAFNVLRATGMPPPMRKNKEPRGARRIWGVSPMTSIRGPHAKPRIMPAYARRKLGLRPILTAKSVAGPYLPISTSLYLPIGYDAIWKGRDETHDRVDHGSHAAKVGQLFLDGVDLA